MNFFSHAKENDRGVREGSKALRDHTLGVRGKALDQFHSGLAFSIEADTLKLLLDDICILHDLGKYTAYFQHYLLGQNIDPNLKQHARFGAFVVYQKLLSNAQSFSGQIFR